MTVILPYTISTKKCGTPTTGEELQTVQESDSDNHPFAVIVVQEGIIAGHVPRDISRVCLHFLERRNIVTGRLTNVLS